MQVEEAAKRAAATQRAEARARREEQERKQQEAEREAEARRAALAEEQEKARRIEAARREVEEKARLKAEAEARAEARRAAAAAEEARRQAEDVARADAEEAARLAAAEAAAEAARREEEEARREEEAAAREAAAQLEAAEALMEAGRASNAQGDHAGARRSFLAARGLHPGLHVALVSAANMAAKLGEMDVAVREWEKVVATEGVPEKVRDSTQRKLRAAAEQSKRRDAEREQRRIGAQKRIKKLSAMPPDAIDTAALRHAIGVAEEAGVAPEAVASAAAALAVAEPIAAQRAAEAARVKAAKEEARRSAAAAALERQMAPPLSRAMLRTALAEAEAAGVGPMVGAAQQLLRDAERDDEERAAGTRARRASLRALNEALPSMLQRADPLKLEAACRRARAAGVDPREVAAAEATLRDVVAKEELAKALEEAREARRRDDEREAAVREASAQLAARAVEAACELVAAEQEEEEEAAAADAAAAAEEEAAAAARQSVETPEWLRQASTRLSDAAAVDASADAAATPPGQRRANGGNAPTPPTGGRVRISTEVAEMAEEAEEAEEAEASGASQAAAARLVRSSSHAELLASIAADVAVAAPRQSVAWELLMREARAADERGAAAAARELYGACHVLSGRVEARVCAANMALKLGDVGAALEEYDEMLLRDGAERVSVVDLSRGATGVGAGTVRLSAIARGVVQRKAEEAQRALSSPAAARRTRARPSSARGSGAGGGTPGRGADWLPATPSGDGARRNTEVGLALERRADGGTALASLSAQPGGHGQAAALLMREALGANEAREPGLARELFDACYVLSGRIEARISAANMALKLGEADEALAEYKRLLETGTLSAKAQAVVERKHDEAWAMELASRKKKKAWWQWWGE